MGTVNKSELARRLAESYPLSQKDAGAVIDAFVDIVKASAEAGDTVRLSGFGTFQVKARAARTARNPATGEQMSIPETRKLAFKAAKGVPA